MCCSVFYSHLYVTNVSRLQTCIAYWKSLWYTRPPVVDLGGMAFNFLSLKYYNMYCNIIYPLPFHVNWKCMHNIFECMIPTSSSNWNANFGRHYDFCTCMLSIGTPLQPLNRNDKFSIMKRGPWWWNHSAMFMVESDY